MANKKKGLLLTHNGWEKHVRSAHQGRSKDAKSYGGFWHRHRLEEKREAERLLEEMYNN